MKTLCLVILVQLIFLSRHVFSAESLIQSKEKISFHKPNDVKFSGLNKISEFIGIIERTTSNSEDLKLVDLYQFKSDTSKIDKKLCANLVEKIFGLSKSKLYESKSFKIIESNKGDICQYYISDKVEPKKNEKEFHRLILVGFINTKAYALVFHPESLTEAKTTEALQVWNNLR